jgi:hypothetical protein
LIALGVLAVARSEFQKKRDSSVPREDLA